MVDSKQQKINSNVNCKQDVKIQHYKLTHMNWEGFGRKLLAPNRGIIPEFSVRNWGNWWTTPVIIASVPSMEYYAYRYDNPLMGGVKWRKDLHSAGSYSQQVCSQPSLVHVYRVRPLWGTASLLRHLVIWESFGTAVSASAVVYVSFQPVIPLSRRVQYWQDPRIIRWYPVRWFQGRRNRKRYHIL